MPFLVLQELELVGEILELLLVESLQRGILSRSQNPVSHVIIIETDIPPASM